MNFKTFKLLTVLTLVLTTTFTSYGQNSDNEITLIQELFGLEKTEMLSDLLGDVNDDFWVVYKEYETKRMNLGKTR